MNILNIARQLCPKLKVRVTLELNRYSTFKARMSCLPIRTDMVRQYEPSTPTWLEAGEVRSGPSIQPRRSTVQAVSEPEGRGAGVATSATAKCFGCGLIVAAARPIPS